MNFDIEQLLLSIPGVIVALSFHEYAHAQIAVWLGDDTPRYQGRLTINPLAHIDPMGFFFLLIARFGWAKPVMIDERNFKNRRRDDILVSIAGPAMNIILAVFFMMLMKMITIIPVSILSGNIFQTIMDIFNYVVVINIVLCVFNLLPIPPLDGSHVFFGLFNLKNTTLYYQFASKGTLILMILIISDRYTNILDTIIGIPVQTIYIGLVNIFF